MKFRLLYLLLLLVGCRHEPIAIEPIESDQCIPIPPAENPPYEHVSEPIRHLAPCYNPTDNNLISYVIEDGQTFASDLVVYNLASKSKQIIAHDIYYLPQWNANGEIAFNGTDNNIRTINVSSLETKILTTDGHSYRPEWSPDGRYIVFKDRRNTGIMNADGTNRHLLFDSVNYNLPAWSPDGKKIAFLKEIEDPVYKFITALVVYDTTLHTFTTIGKSTKVGGYGIDWFPNSEELVWAANAGLYVTSLQGTQKLIKETCSARDYLYPSISSDGKSILVMRGDSRLLNSDTIIEAVDLYIMNVDGSNERKVEF